jgi:hypothetical protein
MIQTQQNLEASSSTPKRNKNALSELRQLLEFEVPFKDAETLKAEVQNVSRKEDAEVWKWSTPCRNGACFPGQGGRTYQIYH